MSLSVFEFFSWGWFLVSFPCSQRKCLIWFQFSWICCLILCPIMWSIFENVPCAFEKNVYFASLGWKALYIPVKCIWSRALFSATVSLLIFCLEDLSIFDSGVLKTPSIIVLLSISFLKSSKIFLIYLGAPMLGTYMFTRVISSWWTVPYVIYSILLCLFLWPLFWNLFCLSFLFHVHLLGIFFFYPFTFSLHRSFVLRWIYNSQVLEAT